MNSESPFAGLPFDVAQRLEFVASTLDSRCVPASAPVIDVGGHPGLLARHLPHRRIVTVDTFAHGPANYVRASGGGLPFRDGAFEAAVCSDTLEHVPPEFREKFLEEMNRVSSRLVVVSGPFHTPGVAEAERVALLLLPPGSPAAGWLREHAQFGLPDLAAVCRLLSRYGHVGASGDGDLVLWIFAFALLADSEQRADLREPARKTLSALAAARFPSGPGPHYRHGVVLDKSLPPRPGETDEISDFLATEIAGTASRRDLLDAALELIPCLAGGNSKGKPANDPDAMRQTFMARLDLAGIGDASARTRIQNASTREPQAARFIVMGENELDFLADDWHSLGEGPGGIPARWTAARPGIRLPSGITTPFSILTLISAPREINGKAVGLSIVDSEDRRLACQPGIGSDGQWRLVAFDIPTNETGEFCFVLESPDTGGVSTAPVTPLTWIADVVFHNGDYRTMSALIAAVAILPEP